MIDVDKKSIRSNYTINYYNPDDYYRTNPRPLECPNDLDITIPIFFGSKKYCKKIIEVLETFGGNNTTNWSCDVETYVYGVSKDNEKSIMCFGIYEFSETTLRWFSEKHLIMKIEDFLKIEKNE